MRGYRSKVSILIGEKKAAFLFGFFAFCFLSSVSAQETRYTFSKKDRDPFSPLVGKNGLILIQRKIDIGGLNIRGIIYSRDSSVAIINDEVVEEGGTIGEYLILGIEEKKVILKKDNKKFILKLEEEE